MKTQAEIEQILLETQLALNDVNEWVDEAYKKNEQLKNFWGDDYDDSEWRAACDAQKVLMEKVNVLNWVLGK